MQHSWGGEEAKITTTARPPAHHTLQRKAQTMRYLMILILAISLAGCEGEQGPAGPMGPAGQDGHDGGGVAAVHYWYNENPLPSNTYEVDIPGFDGLQDGQFLLLAAYAGTSINGQDGLAELPMMTQTNSGQVVQAAAMLSVDGDSVIFTNLQGWYVLFMVTVIEPEVSEGGVY